MQAVLDLVRVLYEPAAVFERVREKPKFLLPFVALAVLLMVISYLALPYYRSAMAQQLAQATQANPAAAEAAQKFAFIGVIVAPVVFALVLVITAFVLWVLVSLFGGEAKFVTLLSVATYVAITGIMLQIAGLAVLMLRGPGAVTSPEDLQPALGLDLLAPGATGFVAAVLKGINPFSVWGLILTGIGISVTHKLSKGTGYTIATVSLLIGVLVVGAFSLLRG